MQIKNTKPYDVLIIGAGGSGLAAAIFAAKQGLEVAVISKVHPLKSHTIAAQGGINATLGNITPDDWHWHAYDTIKASDWLADQDSVEEMCRTAPEIINMLSELGVNFDRKDDGRIDQKIYGGQSTHYGQGELAYRACFAKDRTGHSIMHKLYQQALDLGVNFYNFYFALDLLYAQNKCNGVLCWNIEKGVIQAIISANTIIATGGYSQVYATATSAAPCTGDGNGLVARAGIPLQDMEFVQFHPTALTRIGILITEAARSAGGTLLNSKGERFMEKYAPKFKELAARDVVARAIANEIIQGNGCGELKDHVLLDLTHLTRQYIIDTLPTVFENCHQFLKLDPSCDLIPIAPAAHYTMGGIPTDSNCQVVNFTTGNVEQKIYSLYAIGEAACISVHGAGRLGCNSLLDLIVFAKKVIQHLEPNLQHPTVTSKPVINHDYIQQIFAKPIVNITALTATLQNIMSQKVEVFRSHKLLQQAQQDLQYLETQYKSAGIADNTLQWNVELQHYLELGNMIISAKATIKSALWRMESRGAHWRSDFPQIDDQYLGHTIYTQNLNHDIMLRSVRKSKENVHFYQPHKRNY
ncbi:MAG: FAD-dependent oxidoreductase [Rickettsiaceae bacterium]